MDNNNNNNNWKLLNESIDGGDTGVTGDTGVLQQPMAAFIAPWMTT